MYQSRIRDNKRRGKQARTLVEPDEEQDYGIVLDMLGNGRVRTFCSDTVIRMGRIRGSMRKYAKKVIIDKGDIVIISKREFEDDKVDIVYKYTHEETTKLMKNGMLPATIVKEIQKSDMDDGTTHDYVVFMEDEDATGCDGAADIDIDAI